MTSRTAPTSTPAPSAMLIAVLALLSAVTPFSIDMYLSAFPDMATEFNTSASTIQLTLTSFLIGLALGQLLIGPLSDQFGRRKPLLIGTFACLIASVLCIVAPSIQVLIGLRFVQGFAGAAGVVIARAIIADRAQGAAAARLFAAMMVIGVLAPITAPVLGGFIVEGWGWRTVFAVLAAMNLLMLAGAAFFAAESLPVERRRPGGLASLAGGMRAVLSNRRYLGYTLALGFASAAMFAYIAASPFVLQNILGFSPREYSLIFGACALAVATAGMLSARLVRSVHPRTLLIGGVSAMVVVTGLQLINVTVAGVPLWSTIALMAAFMGTVGFTFSNATTLALEQVRAAAGTGSAVLGFLQYTLGAAATPLVGLAGDVSAVPMGIVMLTAAALAATAIIALTRNRETSSPAPQLVTSS
ncbi:multidrug effflux MFS transporter [Mycolicibacterium sp.]|uniref:multidrug effflux MFS transporter n=1 Tax=Mycolicibacterium sp. TaxID=2320850 RepID=UPI00355EB1D5